MFEGLLQPMHLVVIAVIALLVFGPRRLPELGKGLGDAIRGFKNSLGGGEASSPTPVPQDRDGFGSRSTLGSSDSSQRGPNRSADI